MHEFGGDWTGDKLDRLRKYLSAYTTIFNQNTRASFFTTVYVDAFAGTGYRVAKHKPDAPLFSDTQDEDTVSFLKGSARIALDIEPSFDQYLFVEANSSHVEDLTALCREFPALKDRVEIVRGDANAVLKNWISQTNWENTRAVVFLDPYGMEVKWETINAFGETNAVDLWYLVSLEGINRHLTRNRLPDTQFTERLDLMLGGRDWQDHFYVESPQSNLFTSETSVYKDADLEKIISFVKKKLSESFHRVATNHLILRNKKNVPLFLLCFAAANERGAPTAIKIANHILKD